MNIHGPTGNQGRQTTGRRDGSQPSRFKVLLSDTDIFKHNSWGFVITHEPLKCNETLRQEEN